ncbi:methylated-DNA--[protein]-cysteine S-methyltransferase [Haloferax sp. DFSO60]|uniref:methylated-DNA--[protein]-cysteine S-methyltransferase n=1 Tax=Haloferax sp. DFSO60 TaxID=3388652 RepID=UPI003979E878
MHVRIFDFDVELDESAIDAPLETIHTQIGEYERGERVAFDLDIEIPETFTGRVMRCMLDIPHGETRTYGEVAEKLDSSPIAVGQACGRNPIPLVVPCHRIVGADSLGGFSASGGVTLKRELLTLEGAERTTDAGQLTLTDVVNTESAQPQ